MVERQSKNKNRWVKQNNVEGSRVQTNTKRKKTNLVLNILIIIVSLLIIGSVYFVIFATENKNDAPATKTASSVQKKEDANLSNKDKKEQAKSEKDQSSEKETTSKSDDPNVSEVIKKNWKPVGTSQSGEHINSYDATSMDWKEKIKAFSEATDIASDNMTLWFVGRGKDPATESIGTISSKDKPDETYRVYIKWKDGKGWEPKKVEKLKENDKR
ncbi:YrrS family protein [Listeria aquatica]|uniref:DUF1510 domain-containing protein n=2 Tax=Listeria aquatica TaxID=1494960 RepID=W7AVG1_9LIST|nr:YrrS family protein [Listeria aquatica]EUJ17652.1 hypothetical protein MAQA_11551 [Listeria aquatica FSL S10-1188]MBC1521005.1 DUF1510 family protein [Listeria aquatica]